MAQFIEKSNGVIAHNDRYIDYVLIYKKIHNFRNDRNQMVFLFIINK